MLETNELGLDLIQKIAARIEFQHANQYTCRRLKGPSPAIVVYEKPPVWEQVLAIYHEDSKLKIVWGGWIGNKDALFTPEAGQKDFSVKQIQQIDQLIEERLKPKRVLGIKVNPKAISLDFG